MSRPCTPGRERGGMTPRRERPGHQKEGLDVPVELALKDAYHFPALPKELPALPRGRKDRRACGAWEDLQGGDNTRASSRSVSRSRRAIEKEDAQENQSRARACSFDAVPDDTERRKADSVPTTPRSSILKKPRPSTSEGDVNSAALAKLQEEMQQKMKEMMALMGESQASDVQTQMAAQLTKLLDSAATEPAQVTDKSEELREMTMRSRRLSDPRPMEAPGGASWEYPLSQEEKKARVVMISSAEIESLHEEVERLTIDS